MVLEQFIVASAVFVNPFTYGCMDGELIENGIILPYKKYEEDVEVFFTFDVDIVQFMMAEKGLDIKYYTVDKIREIFDEWIELFFIILSLKCLMNIGSYSNMQMIEDDIVKAQKAMKFKGVIENIGKVCATSGVVATALSPFLPPDCTECGKERKD